MSEYEKILILETQKECAFIRKTENDKINDKIDITDFKVSQTWKDISLIQQSQKNMDEKITNISTKFDKMSDKLDKFIDSVEKNYTKKDTTDGMIKILWTFWISMVLWMWTFIWSLITNNILWK